jgi:hypothetical protein
LSDCCSSSNGTDDRSKCPRCERPGRLVEHITLKALLRPAALQRWVPADYRFCGTASCEVVYFAAGATFDHAELTVPVFQKETPGQRTVCYCFEVTESDLRLEASSPGRESAFARITQLVKDGRCACEVRNPQGSCCLGNVSLAAAAVEVHQRVRAAQSDAR